MEKVRWDTWDELLLGGAVLRHGTACWDVVAGELRSRTHNSPGLFTPQVCEAKYEDLQKHYSGCLGWFEVLKKKRIAELRRALEQSEDSIGSLESKLETLKAERKDDSHIEYDSSRTVSLEPWQKSDGVECTSKDASRDLSSAGSYMHQTQTSSSPESQLLVSKIPFEKEERKLEGLVSEKGRDPCTEGLVSEKERDPCIEGLVSEKERHPCIDKQEKTALCVRAPCIKRRRGMRKRKDCSKDMTEARVEESYLGSADVLSAPRYKEASTSHSGRIASLNGSSGQSRGKHVLDDLMRIYTVVAQNECALVFCWRLDSQKRGRYKKLVRRHMDLNTIKSRITDGSIASTKELLRDLLLIANNALVFYSKNTREHKSAAHLRDIIKALMHDLEDNRKRTFVSFLSSSRPMHKPPAKPRSIRPAKKPNATKKMFSVELPSSWEPLAVAQKGAAGVGMVNTGRKRSLKSDLTSRGRKRTRLK